MENPPFGRSILLTSAYRVPHNLPTNNLGNEPSKSPRESFSSSFVQSTIVCIVQLGTISESRDLGKMPYSYYALVIKSENHQTVWVVNGMRISYCSRYDLESNSTKKKRKSVFNNITWLILFKWDSFFFIWTHRHESNEESKRNEIFFAKINCLGNRIKKSWREIKILFLNVLIANIQLYLLASSF